MYLQTVLELQIKKENIKTGRILQLSTTQSDLLVHNPTSETHRNRTRSTLVFFYILKLFTVHELSNLILKLYIQSLHPDKTRVDRKKDD